MLAQGGAGVLGAEEAPALQLGDDGVDEDLEPAGQGRRHDVEAVRRALGEPPLEVVGDLVGRAREDTVPAAAGEAGDELAHGEVLAAGELGDELEAAAVALGDVVDVGQPVVQVGIGELDVEHRAQLGQPVCRDDELGELGLEGTGLGPGRADDRADAWQHEQLVGSTAVPGEPRLEVGVEGPPVGEGLLRGEDRLGEACGVLLAVLGGPRLDEQRVALHRSGHVERALDAVELALVLDRRDPVGVRVDAGGPVGDDRAVADAVPQAVASSTNSVARS